jgi:hypothetical protein
VREDVWLASVAEMADRVRADNWDDNLHEVLVQYPPAKPTEYQLFLPVLLRAEPRTRVSAVFRLP